MFRGNNSAFDRLVDKATSQLLLEPDWEGILQICDAIRQNDVQPKYALATIKKKIGNENPHVSLFALQVLESVMKNCGDGIHAEVASMEFMKFMKEEINSGQDLVKKKALELVQVWSHAFRNEPRYKIVQDTYHWLKMEGYEFPVLKEADAMFSAERAPDWKDGECCHRCRVGFSLMQRKHHCRACGEIFCSKCSSKSSIIPKYGIEREVRVCESCYTTLNKGGVPEVTGKKVIGEDELPPEYLASPLSQQSQAPPQRSEQEIQEEEELQLALALSKSEAEVKDSEDKKQKRSGKSKHRSNYNSYSNPPADNAVYATVNKVAAPVIDTTDMDPELAKYLNRNYWEQKNEEVKVSTTQPSAPVASAEPKGTTVKVQEKFQNGEVEDEEQFLHAVQASVDIFVNRMKSNSQRGRSIANDSSVQSLFGALNKMHPKLMEHVSQQEDARAHFEMLQDKLAQLKDAREALDALREDHKEKKRREMEELERQRQIQMAHKLEIMRQKKQEYLEYQRQLALQRMQEQEREMQYRLEQQKQMQQMRAMGYAYPAPQMYQQPPPQGYNPAGYSPAGSVEGSPHHQPHPSGAGHYAPGPMGAPPGAPGAQMVAPPMGAQASQPPGAAGGPPTSQPMYSQAQGQPQGAPPVVSYPGGHPGSYQPPGGAQGPYMPPPTSQANMGLPPRGFPNPSLDYQASGPPTMDYSSFNMQNMANALPAQAQGQMHMQGPPGGVSQQQQQPPPPQHQQQHYMPPPQAQYAPQGGPGMPPTGQQHPGGMPPPNQLPPGQHPGGVHPNQPPPGSNEAELISFD